MKGDKSKLKIAQALKEAFGEKYKGEYSKAHYINLSEEGEMIQLKVAITRVKDPIEFDETANSTPVGDFDWSDVGAAPSAPAAVKNTPPAEISEEEINNVKEMLARLGL